ncbi:MAG: hypothetical protein LQ350_007739 [Teloschistes chrysophthalmus]|nr:MAG: hypothetical protein LQ350_007739 [Niorma chrysophthalma]
MANSSVSLPGSPYLGFTSDIVTIAVGNKEVPFYVHKAIISFKSEFFRAALEGSFKGAAEDKVRLPEDDPELFPHYLSWVYGNNSIRIKTKYLSEYDDSWCRLFLLADRLGSEELENLIIDKLCDRLSIDKLYGRTLDNYLTFRPSVEVINLIWDATPSDSGMRKILVDAIAWQTDINTWLELANAPSEFLYTVLKGLSKRLPPRCDGEVAPFDQILQRCKMYHHHKTSAACRSDDE